MALLILFAFVAGAGTAASPCVLPVLPAVLSVGATGGRRRPFAVVLGLAVTFTVTIVGFGALVDGVGLGDGTLRTLAALVLLGFGITLVVPRLAAALEAPLSRLARLGPRSRGDGVGSGLAVGAALGFAYAPCAGPILAAVITVGAAAQSTVPIALAYAAGSSSVLLAFALGGRHVAGRISRAGRGPAVQKALGVVMVLTAAAVAADLDVRFQTALASSFPGAVVNPTGALERSGPVKRRLADLRGDARFAAAPGRASARLPELGAAPEFTGTQRWFNTPGGAPLSLGGLRGKVVLVDFWTYTCINCLRTLPYLKAWDERYRDRGLVVVGVHTPEFRFERDPGNVAAAIGQNELGYAVAQDNEFATWQAWGNQAWPSRYLVDARGQVRYAHVGEGDYEQTEAAIRSLLGEAGAQGLGEGVRVARGEVPGRRSTPETYLGAARAEGFVVPPRPGARRYPGAGSERLPVNGFALGGRWRVDAESAEALAGGRLDARVVAKSVYLVLSSRGDRPRDVRVLLDGRPIRAREAGADVRAGVVSVRRQRLYRLVALPAAGEHLLSLRLPAGVAGFAFTFG